MTYWNEYGMRFGIHCHTKLCAILLQFYYKCVPIFSFTTRCLFLSTYYIFASNACSLVFSHNYSLDFYNGNLQTTTVLFTLNFTQDWQNSYHKLSSILCCPFIDLHNQFNWHSWSRTCVFSLSQELYCDFIFFLMYNVQSCCVRLCWAFVIYLFHTHTDVVGLLITSSVYISGSVVIVLFLLTIIGHFHLRKNTHSYSK